MIFFFETESLKLFAGGCLRTKILLIAAVARGNFWTEIREHRGHMTTRAPLMLWSVFESWYE
jgi:hypothetical protein